MFEFKGKKGERYVKKDEVWYQLCCCKNCKEVHAFIETNRLGSCGLENVDNKISCCNKPDNWCTEDENIIEEFVKANRKKKSSRKPSKV